MRPRRGDTCSPTDEGRYCPERYAAIQREEFIHQEFVGWLWLHPKVDNVTPWDFCPWCGESLPALAEEDDLLDTLRQADGAWDGEDGG